MHQVAAFCPFLRTLPINFDLLVGIGNTLKRRLQENKTNTNLVRCGPRPMSKVCHLPDPICFSLQTTFKSLLCPTCQALIDNYTIKGVEMAKYKSLKSRRQEAFTCIKLAYSPWILGCVVLFIFLQQEQTLPWFNRRRLSFAACSLERGTATQNQQRS